jgi:hypothetical protein
MRRESLEVNGKQVIVEHTVEHGSRRATSRETINSYVRGGVPKLYVGTEEEIQRVIIHNRCIGEIKRTPGGWYAWGSVSDRDRMKVLSIMVRNKTGA